jgi:hypothetical protein
MVSSNYLRAQIYQCRIEGFRETRHLVLSMLALRMSKSARRRSAAAVGDCEGQLWRDRLFAPAGWTAHKAHEGFEIQ